MKKYLLYYSVVMTTISFLLTIYLSYQMYCINELIDLYNISCTDKLIDSITLDLELKEHIITDPNIKYMFLIITGIFISVWIYSLINNNIIIDQTNYEYIFSKLNENEHLVNELINQNEEFINNLILQDKDITNILDVLNIVYKK